MDTLDTMDTFVEQIVAKKKGGREYGIIALVVLGALILTAALFLFIPMLMILVVGIGYGAWWLITSQNVEFEYSVTNGDIDIDQIVAQRKRKRIVSVAGSKIESLLPYNAAEQANRHYDRVVLAAPSAEAATWCFNYHSKKNGHTLVVFAPEQRVLDALERGLNKLVQLEMKRKAAQAGVPDAAEK